MPQINPKAQPGDPDFDWSQYASYAADPSNDPVAAAKATLASTQATQDRLDQVGNTSGAMASNPDYASARSFADTMEKTAHGYGQGLMDLLSPSNAWETIKAVGDVPLALADPGSGAAQRELERIKGLGSTLSNVSDPEVGGRLAGNLTGGLIAPHVIPSVASAVAQYGPEAISAAGRGVGAIGDLGTTGAGGFNLKNIGLADLLFRHDPYGAAIAAAPYVAKGVGSGLEALGGGLGKLRDFFTGSGEAPVIERYAPNTGGAEPVVGPTAPESRIPTQNQFEAELPVQPEAPARTPEDQTREIMRDQANLQKVQAWAAKQQAAKLAQAQIEAAKEGLQPQPPSISDSVSAPGPGGIGTQRMSTRYTSPEENTTATPGGGGGSPIGNEPILPGTVGQPISDADYEAITGRPRGLAPAGGPVQQWTGEGPRPAPQSLEDIFARFDPQPQQPPPPPAPIVNQPTGTGAPASIKQAEIMAQQALNPTPPQAQLGPAPTPKLLGAAPGPQEVGPVTPELIQAAKAAADAERSEAYQDIYSPQIAEYLRSQMGLVEPSSSPLDQLLKPTQITRPSTSVKSVPGFNTAVDAILQQTDPRGRVGTFHDNMEPLPEPTPKPQLPGNPISSPTSAAPQGESALLKFFKTPQGVTGQNYRLAGQAQAEGEIPTAEYAREAHLRELAKNKAKQTAGIPTPTSAPPQFQPEIANQSDLSIPSAAPALPPDQLSSFHALPEDQQVSYLQQLLELLSKQQQKP